MGQMNKKTLLRGVVTLIIVMVFASCGNDITNDQPSTSGGTTLTDNATFDTADQNHLYNLFKTEYYWSDKVQKGLDVSIYSEPQTMIDALKYGQLDRWSFVYTLEQYDNFSTQKNSGFGFAHGIDELGNIIIKRVLISSPADLAGLKRGDILVKINGEDATDALITQTKGKEIREKGGVPPFRLLHRYCN
jgi:carboxyl-terminal processing protease